MMKSTRHKSILHALLAREKKCAGNSLAEYALPLALVVVSAGVIASAVNIQTILPQYFAEASGSAAGGTTIATTMMGGAPGGATGTGAGAIGFSDGNGGSGSILSMAGQSTPPETVGNNGTDGLIWSLHHAITQVGGFTDGDNDGGQYIPLTVDLALTTQTGQFSNAPILAAKGNAIASYAESHTIEIMTVGSQGFADNQDLNGEQVTDLENQDNSQSGQVSNQELANVNQGGLTQEQAQQVSHLMGMMGESTGFETSTNYQALDEEMFLDYMNNLSQTRMNCSAYHIEQFEGNGQVDYNNLAVSGLNNGCP